MITLRHPSVLSALAGRNEGDFCRRIGLLGVGMVTVGGISVDEETMNASRKMVERGRREFLFCNVNAFLEENIQKARESGALVCVNIRSATLEGYVRAGGSIRDLGGVVEVNAHCRQKEITDLGAGQALLADRGRLRSVVEGLQEVGVEPVVKFRGNVVDERTLIEDVGMRMVHVDAYREGVDTIDFTVVERIRHMGTFVIAGNSIRDGETASRVLTCADAFSFARIADDEGKVRSLLHECGLG